MARDSSDYREICPFWAMQAMKCQLCREGLFIPPNDHIEVYCKTLHYPQCLQYSLHSANHLLHTEENKQNRRKYARVASCHRVTLVELAQGRLDSHLAVIPQGPKSRLSRQAAQLSFIITAKGNTVDLSKGGMRLTTGQPLTKATIVWFSFEEKFPKSVQTGQGQIAWCSKQNSPPDYQVGIAFQDARLIDIMGLYLELITSIPPAVG